MLETYKSSSESFCNNHFQSADGTLILMESGCLCVKDADTTLRIDPYEGVYLTKNTTYFLEFLCPSTYFVFRFKADYPLFPETRITFQDVERVRSTVALLDTLEKNLITSSFAYSKALFAGLVTQYAIEHACKVSAKAFQDPVISGAISYLQNHIRNDWKIEDISAIYNLSPAQFSKRFQSVTQMTPAKYMSYLRIQKAKELLSDSNLRIKEIASECGFANEYYFSNFFKKHTGLSPANFRKEILNIR